MSQVYTQHIPHQEGLGTCFKLFVCFYMYITSGCPRGQIPIACNNVVPSKQVHVHVWCTNFREKEISWGEGSFSVLTLLLHLSTSFLSINVLCTTNQVIEVIISTVSGIVLAQSPHHDHADQTNQEDDHHKGVEDGEPVDLKVKNKSLES